MLAYSRKMCQLHPFWRSKPAAFRTGATILWLYINRNIYILLCILINCNISPRGFEDAQTQRLAWSVRTALAVARPCYRKLLLKLSIKLKYLLLYFLLERCTMCERCEEEERRDEILKSFEKQKNQNRSCPIPKVEKSEEDEFFKKWYADISKMSRQLRECVLSSSSYLERMSKLYTQLQHLDLKNDKNEICGILKELKDYAIMATTTDGVAVKTADIILSMIVGQH